LGIEPVVYRVLNIENTIILAFSEMVMRPVSLVLDAPVAFAGLSENTWRQSLQYYFAAAPQPSQKLALGAKGRPHVVQNFVSELRSGGGVGEVRGSGMGGGGGGKLRTDCRRSRVLATPSAAAFAT
jgi:hypothetical protein